MQNTIRINRSSTADGIELLHHTPPTRVIGASLPDRLFLPCLRHADAANSQAVLLRRICGGWAYYTEQISYEYAAQVLAEAEGSLGSSYPAALLCTLLAQQRDLQINLFCLLDLSLHYYGAEESELLRSLESFGLSARAVGTCLRLSAHCPCGLFEVLRWLSRNECPQKRAELQWSDNFSLLRFHRFVLEAGPSDFENLTKRLKQTAAKTG